MHHVSCGARHPTACGYSSRYDILTITRQYRLPLYSRRERVESLPGQRDYSGAPKRLTLGNKTMRFSNLEKEGRARNRFRGLNCRSAGHRVASKRPGVQTSFIDHHTYKIFLLKI